jgi:hypothetical protein
MNTYNKVMKQAGDHVLLESKDLEIKRLKSAMFKESLNAESSFDKIVEALSDYVERVEDAFKVIKFEKHLELIGEYIDLLNKKENENAIEKRKQ